MLRAASSPSFVDLYTPKLVTVLREGYGLCQLRADAIAGLTVAIVALPLSMAIAIASGATPAQGLYSAIVGGFLISALGGSRFQIGGPAGAFIVLVAATVAAHGMEGLILATILSGFILAAMGLLRIGTYVKFVPYPVTVGFTAGIAVIIFASQIKEMFGLTLAGPEPGALLEKLPVLWQALPSFNAASVGVAAATVAVILGLRRWRPQWPGLLIAVAGAALATWFFALPVETIGTRFGGISAGFPVPALPDLSWAKIVAVLPNAVSFAMLGAIESLLSAVVADGMTGRRHRSNCELVAQGIANLGSGLFGGICVTGTIARTATNVRSGAHGPVAGMLHAAFLLLFVLLAAAAADPIPLAALAGVLAVVAWNMVERHAVATLLRVSRGDAAVLATTFLLTIFRDLGEAIVVGFAMGAMLFIHRMSISVGVSGQIGLGLEDRADDAGAARTPYRENAAGARDIAVYRISGAFFFGAAASIGSVLDNIGDAPKALIVDFSAVALIDSTAAHIIEGLAHKCARGNVALVLTGTNPDMRQTLFALGVKPPLAAFEKSVEKAVADLRRPRAEV